MILCGQSYPYATVV